MAQIRYCCSRIYYEFIGWNTKHDGSGTSYQVGETGIFSENIFLHAQWKKIVNDEDINNNPDLDDGDISDDEEKDNGINNDNQEEDNNSSSNDNSSNNSSSNNNSSNNNNPVGDNNNSSGGGTGTVGGSSSGGGNGTSGNVNSSANSSDSVQNGSSSDNITSNDNIDEENNKVEEEKDKIYYFSFMVGVKEFANTSCNVLDDGKCKLVFPKDNPIKEGYTFKGWSLTNLCNGDIINNSVDMNTNATYYACFDINIETVKNKNGWVYLIVGVWVITGIIIYRVVKTFINKSKNIDID